MLVIFYEHQFTENHSKTLFEHNSTHGKINDGIWQMLWTYFYNKCWMHFLVYYYFIVVYIAKIEAITEYIYMLLVKLLKEYSCHMTIFCIMGFLNWYVSIYENVKSGTGLDLHDCNLYIPYLIFVIMFLLVTQYTVVNAMLERLIQ